MDDRVVVQMLATGLVRVVPARTARMLVYAGLALPVLDDAPPCVLEEVQVADPVTWRTR